MIINPKVSVVIPVYNSEKYLVECVDSFQKQTLVDIEILLINDGSTDLSGTICNNLAKNDCRIRVYHKENEGVACARQLGIENIRGKYCIHADSDDHVSLDMLEKLYVAAESKSADMVICDFYIENQDKCTISKQKPSTDCQGEQLIIDILTNKIHGSLCNKLIRSEIIKHKNIKFISKQNYCEDVLFLLSIAKHINTIIYIPKPFYYYNQNNNPQSLTRLPTKYGNEIRLNYYKHLKELGYYNIIPEFNRNKAISLNAYIAFANRYYTNKEYIAKYREWKKEIWNGGVWYQRLCNGLCLTHLMWFANILYWCIKKTKK